MKEDRGFLKPEDYVEPRCVLCDDPYGKPAEVKAVPQRRIIEKTDEYMSRKDYDGAERHLLYWLEEARLGHDLRGELAIRNELIGHFRKRGNREGAYENIEAAEKLVKELEMENTISAGTTFTNIATACYTFGDYENAISFFEKAKTVYEGTEKTDKTLLGGLYNNMGLACAACGDFERAEEMYQKAMQVMESVPDGLLEQAITCLNMANAREAEKGMEEAEPEIFSLLDQAEELLYKAGETAGGEGPHAGYYAFVCESCAPTFSYYGYFLTAEELKRRAKEIYERNGAV